MYSVIYAKIQADRVEVKRSEFSRDGKEAFEQRKEHSKTLSSDDKMKEAADFIWDSAMLYSMPAKVVLTKEGLSEDDEEKLEFILSDKFGKSKLIDVNNIY